MDSTAQWPLNVLERYGLTPRRVAVVLVGTTLALAVVIGVTRFVGPHLVQAAFNPDAELRIPALYSGMLLLLAAGTALLSRHRGISFLLHPRSFADPGEVVGAERLHRVLRGWLTDLGHPEPTGEGAAVGPHSVTALHGAGVRV